MSKFRPPHSPQAVGSLKIRQFNGMDSDEDSVLRLTNFKGWDISMTIANNVVDFDLMEYGTLKKRGGSRKYNSTGYAATIEKLFYMQIMGIRAFGYIFNGTLSVDTIPRSLTRGDQPFDFVPAATRAAVANDYPAANQEDYS